MNPRNMGYTYMTPEYIKKIPCKVQVQLLTHVYIFSENHPINTIYFITLSHILFLNFQKNNHSSV